MRQLATVLLIAAVVVLAVMLHSQSAALKALQQQPVVAPPAPSMELQGRCAKQAREEFNQEGYESKHLAGFSNHYSSKMGHCFVVIDNTEASSNSISTSKTLSDAFEGKTYASYIWINSQGKKYWEVAPTECTVTMPSGEDKTCKSSDEWDEAIKVYMEAP